MAHLHAVDTWLACFMAPSLFWPYWRAGVNLLAVMCHPDVDYTRTVSNDIIEMLQTLGIEAARNALLKELRGGWTAQLAWVGATVSEMGSWYCTLLKWPLNVPLTSFLNDTGWGGE